jgi:hypothetical protein
MKNQRLFIVVAFLSVTFNVYHATRHLARMSPQEMQTKTLVETATFLRKQEVKGEAVTSKDVTVPEYSSTTTIEESSSETFVDTTSIQAETLSTAIGTAPIQSETVQRNEVEAGEDVTTDSEVASIPESVVSVTDAVALPKATAASTPDITSTQQIETLTDHKKTNGPIPI